MPKKFTFEEVKAYFEERGCTLLATEYMNNATPMPYICECGGISRICLSDFKANKRCKACGIIKTQKANRTPFEEVKAYFEEQGCTLLASEYVDSCTSMPYICECGRRSKINFARFKKGGRCRVCGNYKIGKALKTPFEEVKAYFEEQGCTLLASEYVDSYTSMPYICECGRRSKISFANFKRNKRCRVCGIVKLKKANEAQKTLFEEVKAYFEEQGCTLLATYVNANTPIPYICECGRRSKTQFNNFKKGVRCRACGIIKMQEAQRIPFEEVKAYYEERGCTLLANEYTDCETSMPYICKCGQKSSINFQAFRKTVGCKSCKPKSLGEKCISEYLKKMHISFDTEIESVGRKRFDFELLGLDNRFFIEYNGCQHYRPTWNFESLTQNKYKKFLYGVRNDYIKFDWCRQHKFPLLIIPYWDLKRIPTILDDLLAGRVPKFSATPKKVQQYSKIRDKVLERYNIDELPLCGLFNI